MKLLGNSYVLGILMLVAEGLLKIVTEFSLISGIVLSFVAGNIYAQRHETRMPLKEKIKLLGVYLGVKSLTIVPIILLTALTGGNFGWVMSLAMVVLFGVFGLVMYVGLTTGSHLYMKSSGKKPLLEQESKIQPTTPEINVPEA